jgi:hypothetical protein
MTARSWKPWPMMLDERSFTPMADNFVILFPDGVVHRTSNEESWDSLDQYKESKCPI